MQHFSRYLLLAAALFCAFSLFAQPASPLLMRVGDKPVYLNEFEYLYKKTNAGKSDYSKASLDEYLDLFTKFKLKVAQANEMGLDTVKSLTRELDSYRKQLSDSYLIDREVTDRLIKEVFDFSQRDVFANHILIVLGGNTPADTLAAFNKAKEMMKRVTPNLSKSDFAQLARLGSEDKNTKDNGGEMGWLSPMLPSGFYALESAIFNLKVGQTAGPVRSPMGYHIVMVSDARPARGEIEVAHILIRDSRESANPNAKTQIDAAYTALTDLKTPFEDLAIQLSEDNNTKEKGGYLGFFGINKYETAFEDAAFGIEADGGISKPFRTSVGWHIVKRINLRKNEGFDVAKNRIKPKVQRDDRYRLAKLSMIERIKRDAGYVESPENLLKFANTLDTTFLTAGWKRPVVASTDPLITLGKRVFTAGDYTEYLFLNSRRRVDGARSSSPALVAQSLFTDFTEESVLRFEESQLEAKYPDFRMLMGEYRDGMMLFEATKQLVWDRATQDSTGLEQFFIANQTNYRWSERAEVAVISIREAAKPQQAAILKSLKKKGLETTLRKFNATEQLILSRTETMERGRTPALDALKWKVGATTTPTLDTDGKTQTMYLIKAVMPPSNKTLKEARGFVVADFQDMLEKNWVEQLKTKFPVAVERSVFENLIKK